MRTPAAFISVSLLTCLAATAQDGWIKLESSCVTPPGRAMGGFVSLDIQGQCLQFGGETMEQGGTTYGDTWLWDGSTWREAAPTSSPRALEGVAMAYDIVRNRAVMVPGWDGNTYVQETWEWDAVAEDWQQMAPATQPRGRDWSAIAYDLARNNCVMFGGHDWQEPNGNGSLADTWTWDGVNWTSHAVAGPTARWGHAMAFDSANNSVLMFGGSEVNGVGNETWSWDGAAWTQLAPATVPPARQWHQMVFDGSRGRIVMVGGEWAGAFVNDAWEWTGTDWQQLTIAGPAPAAGSLRGMAYDLRLGGVVQFGGSVIPNRGGSTDETWVLHSSASNFASTAVYGSGCGAGTGSSIYEQFTAATPFDFAAGTGWSMFLAGGGYTVISGLNPIVAPIAPPIAFGDDATQQIALPWPLPLADGSTTSSIWVCSNGFIALEPTTSTTYLESATELLSGPARIAPLWDDLNPSAGGTINAEQDPTNPNLFHVTFTGVPEYGTTNSNDFQVSFEQAGGIEVKYGAVASLDSIVGYSPGNGATDPGSIDLSAASAAGVQTGNDFPALTFCSQGGTRPRLGTTLQLAIDGVPPTAGVAVMLLSAGQVNPGIDLTVVGFTGCSLYVSGGVSAPIPITGSTAAIALTLPNPSTLQGVSLYVQGAVSNATNVQPIPVAFTNGVELRIDSN